MPDKLPDEKVEYGLSPEQMEALIAKAAKAALDEHEKRNKPKPQAPRNGEEERRAKERRAAERRKPKEPDKPKYRKVGGLISYKEEE